MNTDAEIPNKNEQIEFNNTLKNPYTMTKWDLSPGCKDVSKMQINKCDTPH